MAQSSRRAEYAISFRHESSASSASIRLFPDILWAMRFIPRDSEYKALMLALDREQAEARRVMSRELRMQSAQLSLAAGGCVRSGRSARRAARFCTRSNELRERDSQ